MNPGLVIAACGLELGGTQLAKHRPGWEGLAQQGNPCLTTALHQRLLWRPGACELAAICWQNCVSSDATGLAGFAVGLQCEEDGRQHVFQRTRMMSRLLSRVEYVQSV
ncbi:UNVERIFIED_CONTAM: hypothetical protein FKN15_017035 [Acipenser sinensis]